MKLKYVGKQIGQMCRQGFIRNNGIRGQQRNQFYKLTARGRLAHDIEQWQNNGIAHIKLFCRGDCCAMPDNSEYLLVVAYDFDTNGNWFPHYTTTADSYSELICKLRKLASTADAAIIEGSERFMQLAQELRLPMLNGQWRLV